MKKLNTAIFLLIAAGFAAVGIMISHMPPEVPIHYNALGEVDNMGSPYTYLIFPALSVLCPLLLIPANMSCMNPNERKALQYVTVFTVLLFTAMGVSSPTELLHSLPPLHLPKQAPTYSS